VFIRRDLTPLLTTDLDGAPLGAVRDYAIDTTAHPWAQIEGGTQARPYLNAGVLVIDVPLWRRTGLGDRALRYVEDHGESPSWDDQRALNAVIDRWHELDPIWNVQLLNLAVMVRTAPGGDVARTVAVPVDSATVRLAGATDAPARHQRAVGRARLPRPARPPRGSGRYCSPAMTSSAVLSACRMQSSMSR
jgi:hypothetical protein